MEPDLNLILYRLFLALAAGGIIGIERAFHGREAGFRTHTLVCVSSSLLMLLMAYSWHLIPQQYIDTVRTDPTRMAQGIMTGIGFLGAGVIIKEGLTVRGLTTAASIWMTASIGIVIGLGFYQPAMIATVITVVTLSMFRWIESMIPSQKYARLMVSFKCSQQSADEDSLRQLITEHKIKAFESGYELSDEGRIFQYEMTMRTKDVKNYRALAQSFMEMDDVLEFSITPSS